MRDRLVELLCNVKCEGEECFGNCPHRIGQKCNKVQRLEMCSVFAIADHLLSEGVIVPPYKPLPLIDEGDRVLCPQCETDLMGCYIGYDNTPTVVTCYECGAWIDCTKAVDRKEAEKALAERSGE